MRSPRLPRPARAVVLALLPLSLLAFAPAAAAQTFALGAGGGLLNDTGSAEVFDAFSTGAAYAFVEVELDKGLLMQGRYTRMELPPTAENGPDVDLDVATISVAYLFKEDWWQAGFVVGGGGYFLRPKAPGEGQVVTDPKESVWGVNGGLLTIFSVNRRINVRLEALWHLLDDVSDRKPLVASAAIAWRF
ncbi:MAG: hypothetical protein KJ062_09185 [Thermoanaerobaculia bacterium]|nr:hypothetical protein [Thermoanaerobaculia bacterium]